MRYDSLGVSLDGEQKHVGVSQRILLDSPGPMTSSRTVLADPMCIS